MYVKQNMRGAIRNLCSALQSCVWMRFEALCDWHEPQHLKFAHPLSMEEGQLCVSSMAPQISEELSRMAVRDKSYCNNVSGSAEGVNSH